jgi:hypothetical protein
VAQQNRRRYIFLPLPSDRWHENILVRTVRDPSGFISALDKQVQAVDSDVTVFAETLDGLLTNHPEFVFRALALFLHRHRTAGIAAGVGRNLRQGEL